MPAKTKKKREWKGIDLSHITVVDNMPDYSNDPYFKKKKKEAEELIKKHPIPKDWLTNDGKKVKE